MFRAPTPDDAEAITALLIACDIADFGTPDYDLDALLAEWAEPGVDIARDGVYTAGAYGHVSGADIRAWVHPDRRGEGLGSALAEALETRAREKGLPHVDQQMPRSDVAGIVLLESRGYVPLRSYAELRLPDTAVAGLPSGGTRPYDEARDEAAVEALMARVSGDGDMRHVPLDVLRARNPDTSLWVVADAPDGSLAGAVRSELRPAGFITGYVMALAVEPGHRGQGLGSRLLGATARAMVEQGASVVRLHVRSSNPGALHLYERLGFAGDWQVDELRLAL